MMTVSGADKLAHYPQVDDGRLLGMASMRDVVHIMLKEHREEVERLQEYIQGTI